MLPDRGPDGNTVVVVGPSGLIVVDTGRHPWHSDGILAFARERRLPVHDRRQHPLAPGPLERQPPREGRSPGREGLHHHRRRIERWTLAASWPATWRRRANGHPTRKPRPRRLEETALFLATMEAADSLRPDVPVEQSGMLDLAGRKLAVRVAADAVTDADLWLYDEATGVAVIGDLVTLPAPFFESACPAGWQSGARCGVGHAISRGRARTWCADEPCRVRHVSARVRQVSSVCRQRQHRRRLRRRVDPRTSDRCSAARPIGDRRPNTPRITSTSCERTVVRVRTVARSDIAAPPGGRPRRLQSAERNRVTREKR